jgi:DNA polymerase-3 subunit epsilon
MRTALILDTETTGDDPTIHECVEVAAVLYSIESRTPLMSIATVIPVDENPMEHVNHIPAAATQRMSALSNAAIELLKWMLLQADCVIAHNKMFDRGFVEQFVGAETLTAPWVCSATEIEWQNTKVLGKPVALQMLALLEGVAVIPDQQHRALADCELLVEVMKRTPEMGDRLALALEPKVTVVALVDFAHKDQAKEAGFHWNAKDKSWELSVPQSRVSQLEALPFQVRQKA